MPEPNPIMRRPSRSHPTEPAREARSSPATKHMAPSHTARIGLCRSLHPPAITMPSSDIASGPPKRNPYRGGAPRAVAAAGMTVALPMDSNAITETMPNVAARYSRVNNPGSVAPYVSARRSTGLSDCVVPTRTSATGR